MFVYAALGDSITYGQDASSVCRTYPSRIISLLKSHGVRARRIVFARSGWTSADLAEHLYEEPGFLHDTNAVSLWIGGDDLIRYGLSLLQHSGDRMEDTILQYRKRLDLIIGFIRGNGPRHIVCCTQYNPFPSSRIAVKAIRILNQAIMESASSKQCLVARVDRWFAGKESRLIWGYRSGDITDISGGFPPIHPNDNGHEIIASELFPLIYSSKDR
jgi:lysophospholipase L1-like esterase